jgi:isocitrate dehydrogenase
MDLSLSSSLPKISFLATGDEIVSGDIQDTNSRLFAQAIHQLGGLIYQHLQVTDKKNEISLALEYLLRHSDAVVITGGLGPTSDDTTRFAIADVTKAPLVFYQPAWDFIVTRLARYNVAVSESNRQQALFPQDADIYPNLFGTAFGSHVEWQGRHIFMLPGPPKECVPMFEKYVLPHLIQLNFLHKKKLRRWLTLGLVEGEIAAEIDLIAKSYAVETGYRWSYPYLEIKVAADEDVNLVELVNKIDRRLEQHIVSIDGQEAIVGLNNALLNFPKILHVYDAATQGQLAKMLVHPQLTFITKEPTDDMQAIWFGVKSEHLGALLDDEYSGTINIFCTGYLAGQLVYEHKILISNRGPEVLNYVLAYIAWQIKKFMDIVG